jgi:hypothetical protein
MKKAPSITDARSFYAAAVTEWYRRLRPKRGAEIVGRKRAKRGASRPPPEKERI